MQVEDFDGAWDQLAKAPVNERWQKEMGRFFEPVPDQLSGERFAMMKEVFYSD
jgi:L-rhamnose mutarotase